MTSQEVKSLLYALGAELCGIAGIERFADAPEGFHPRDVMPVSSGQPEFLCGWPLNMCQ